MPALTRDQLQENAESLLALVLDMEAERRYLEHDDHMALTELAYSLAPVRQAMGSKVVHRPTTGQPKLWFFPLKDQARQMVAWLRANPDWRPGAGPPEPSGWAHPRLWAHVKSHVKMARESDEPRHWESVSREATVFLEHELREIRGVTNTGREGLAVAAFNEGVGPLRLGASSQQQRSWRFFAMGLLAGEGNRVAHRITGHPETYAMGVVGSVSLLLTAMDERYGEPAEGGGAGIEGA